jgi:hypothetical protein
MLGPRLHIQSAETLRRLLAYLGATPDQLADLTGAIGAMPERGKPTTSAGASCTENGQNRGKSVLPTEAWFMDTKSIYPTVNEINALPSKVKRYIHQMQINQNGQALTVMQLREERDLLHQRVKELETRIAFGARG